MQYFERNTVEAQHLINVYLNLLFQIVHMGKRSQVAQTGGSSRAKTVAISGPCSKATEINNIPTRIIFSALLSYYFSLFYLRFFLFFFGIYACIDISLVFLHKRISTRRSTYV